MTNTRSAGLFIGLTMAAALAVSGCGGGSSESSMQSGEGPPMEPGGGPPMGSDTPAPTQFSMEVFDSEWTDTNRRHLRAAAGKAARNTPNAGSVTQSSIGDGAATAASVRVTREADGTMRYGGTIEGYGRAGSVYRWRSDQGRVLAEPRGEGWRGIQLYQAVGGGAYLSVYTDIEAPATRTLPAGSDGTVPVPSGSYDRVTFDNVRGNVNISTGSAQGFPGSFNGQEGVLRCSSACRVAGSQIVAGTWSFTPDRPPGAQDVPGTAAGVVFTGTFNNSGTEGTFHGRAGSFRCISTSCGRSVSNGRLSALTGEWIFVPSGGTVTGTTPDADYLAGGIWVSVAISEDNAAGYQFGAFMDGSDPFRQANLAGLTGTATYTGDATAVYSYQPTNRHYFVDGDVRLTADFGDASSLGSISGTVSNFRGEGPEPGWYEGGSVMLGTAQIGDDNSGFFTGDTSTRSSDPTDPVLTGKWGGQFYGNGATGAHPGSVAGTFGGTTDDGSQTYVGVYGAHRR